jgi:hypothetical protein
MASSRLLTNGTITPDAPRSSTRMIIHGSLKATRASGVAPAASIAANIATIVVSSAPPCWRSTHT